jgi:hypothetical protein
MSGKLHSGGGSCAITWGGITRRGGGEITAGATEATEQTVQQMEQFPWLHGTPRPCSPWSCCATGWGARSSWVF